MPATDTGDIVDIKPFCEKYIYDCIGIWDKWLLLVDCYNAIEFGFDKYRLATPDIDIDVEETKGRIKEMEARWEWERNSRPYGRLYSGPLALTQMPDNAQMYLYEMDKKLKKERRIIENDWDYPY